ncbi:MAG: phosphoribosylformylglycinamidine synthase subunit PurQ [Capsulimonadaceae bacterium]|nr:phosphoribosylformylglycinamidine synthase subunit PurQ [Capsulimonadaceae bacterium]
MKFGVARFPGSNCDQDAYYAIKDVLGQPVEYLWHQEADLKGADVVVIPGGFSFGDYLRCGAIARFAPVMEAVQEHAAKGGIVIGICNGFQILCESRLLPGALIRNDGQKFVCKHVSLRVENTNTVFTRNAKPDQILSIPVAHGEGKYVCDDQLHDQLQANGQILFRYASDDENPNGSIDNIAGIMNTGGNVFGMMPHPERACDKALGSADGLVLLGSLLNGRS